jgi:hypothetical protein
MNANNTKKKDQLGVSHGTLGNQLKKQLLFKYVKLAGDNFCFQCGAEITDIRELSVEHKSPWLDSDNPRELFMDMDNIAFSHLSCNIRASRPRLSNHGTDNMVRTGCKCTLCNEKKVSIKEKQRASMKALRERRNK